MHCLHFVRDEQLSATELTAKLEPAFLSGLRCPHVQIRTKFFEVTNYCTLQCSFHLLLSSFSLSPSLPLPPHITVIKVFDASIQPRLFDRLLYIMCSQNWEHCGVHYWIKQCIEVQHVLSTRMYV